MARGGTPWMVPALAGFHPPSPSFVREQNVTPAMLEIPQGIRCAGGMINPTSMKR